MRNNFFLLPFILILTAVLVFPGNAKQTGKIDYQKLLDSFEPRNIGPAKMGGRVVDIAVDETNGAVIYAAIGPSGLWKSVDHGIHWFPSFHKEKTVSVGAVVVSRSHPDVVWVGTGEATSRNSIGIGDGVYKSTDGGKTWKHMGLDDTRHIDRVLIDPNNPDIVYIGAMGHLWGPNKERGVFKTIDGGKTWKKILYFDQDTGIADMAMDPSNSLTLYAAAYNHRRLPYHFTSGGKHSGLYKTTDGGETWKQLTKGLPKGVNGRIGVDICDSKPNVVYTIVENKKPGIFRSEDKGETWTRMCGQKTYNKVNFRPFYYSKITVDPNNDNVVYAYSGRAYKSVDRGKTFKMIAADLHADHHRIWVDPKNSDHLIDGNDGGIDVSWDGGKSWYYVTNTTWSEVYQLTYDMRDPYYVYVGLQDNGSWAGPSNSLDKKGIMNFHWYPVGGGDGFYAQVDPRDHNVVYRNLQMGWIERYDHKSGQEQDIVPRASLDDEPYRFNWNSPIHISPHNPDVVYFGGNFLFKTTDKGSSWVKVSPDLSTNDPEKQKDSGGPITADNTGAEVHCSIFTVAESPVKEGIIWAGTDDGNLWVTTDVEKKWTNVVINIKKLPKESWVSRVEPSHFSKDTVYVTFDRHRSDDYAPYIYRSDDLGKTWVSLRNNLPPVGYLYVVREDPVNRDLLYVGSEFGLFFSFDRGKRWIPFKKNFPTTAVRDIAVHPRDNDLIIGTHGRGAWIIDDISPLQRLSPDVAKKAAHMFPVRPGMVYFPRKASQLYGGVNFTAPNPEPGAAINLYIAKLPEDAKSAAKPAGKEKACKKDKKDAPKLTISIADANGKEVRSMEVPYKKGFNRIYWDLRGNPVFKKVPEALKEATEWFGIPKGPFVLPGKYTATVKVGNDTLKQDITVKKDKNLEFPVEEWKQYQAFVNRVNDLMRKGMGMVYGIAVLEKQLAAREKEIAKKKKKGKTIAKALEDKIKEAKETLKLLKTVFYSKAAEGFYRIPIKTALHGGSIPEQVFMMASSVNRFPGKPTATYRKRMDEISKKAFPMFMKAMSFINKDLPVINKLLRENDLDGLKLPDFDM